MTYRLRKAARLAASLSLFVATAAVAEPEPDAIMLEKIGAVRMVRPDEVRQRQMPLPSRDEHVPPQRVR